jgi:glycosyltransferase involved in cell wall biosynthesis
MRRVIASSAAVAGASADGGGTWGTAIAPIVADGSAGPGLESPVVRDAGPPDLLLVGPAGSGGVADVFDRLVATMRAASRAPAVVWVPNGIEPEAWIGLRAAWRARSLIRRAGSVHIEFGSNDRAVFWFAVLGCVLRGSNVLVAHDIPKLAHVPGSGLLRRRNRLLSAVAYRVVSPIVDPLVRALVRRRAGGWLVLGDDDVRVWRPRVRGEVRRLHLGWDLPTAAVTSPSAGRHVLFAGFVGASKGVDLLVDAWVRIARADDPPLVIAGDSHEPAWTQEVRRRGEAAARPPRWLGPLDEAAFAELFGDAALVVLPYRFSSAASGILVRALAVGRPVVATRMPALAGLVDDGVQGRIVEQEDVEALGAAIRELLDDPAARDRLGAAAAERARRELSWERHLEDLEGAYEAARRRASS